jgi:hypothetical protein
MNAKYLVLPAALFALSIVAHGDGFGNTFGFEVAFNIDPRAFDGGQRQQQQPRRLEHHTPPAVKSGVGSQEPEARAEPAGTDKKNAGAPPGSLLLKPDSSGGPLN